MTTEGTHGERSWTEFCPRFHRAIELVGKRWSGAILRALLAGDHRFNELLGAIPGLSDRLLTERLRELEEEGLVRRDIEPGPPLRITYTLTEKGSELRDALWPLAIWAERWMTDETDPVKT
ncbi:MAG TPA: helix-turn-helix domain-containing protein [Candidatus Dormibacteraeota bacterium]|nr:helix-turn-helix domain-containing protein [Candidatus Dormibacteraeota bacterium]